MMRPGETPERFLQRFKRLCAKEGILKELKQRRYFEKPSERERRRAKEARRTAIRETKRGIRGARGARPARRESTGASREPART